VNKLMPVLLELPPAFGNAGDDSSPPILALGQVALLQSVDKLSQRLAGITDQTQGLIVAADFLRVDINMDYLRARGNLSPAIRAVLVGTCSDQDDKIGAADQCSGMASK
jgi:hypothetical protein